MIIRTVNYFLLLAVKLPAFCILSFMLTLVANAIGETPKGEITARGCNSITHQKTKQELVAFTANFSANTYQIDEGLELFITAHENAFVTVIDQGSDPNESRRKVLFENVELVAGKKQRFPPEGYKLAVKPPAGINTFEIFLDGKKIVLDEQEEGENGETSRDIDLEKLPEVKEQPTRCIMTFEVIE